MAPSPAASLSPAPAPAEGPQAEGAALADFPGCACSDLFLCQLPGWPTRYDSRLCDVSIVVSPPGAP